MNPQHRIPLTALPRDLAAFTDGPPPSYRRVYGLVLDGRLPAEQENGRWYFRRSDLPAIAASLGLMVPEAAATAERNARAA